MSESAINSYRDLRVWQSAMSLAVDCYTLTKRFPREEMFGLTSQIRRSASSVPANIAEGHGRESTQSFIQHLRISQGLLKELETHLLLAARIGLVDGEAPDFPLASCDALGKMLHALIRSLQSKNTGRK